MKEHLPDFSLRNRILANLREFDPEFIDDYYSIEVDSVYPPVEGPTPSKFTDQELNYIIQILNSVLGINPYAGITLLGCSDGKEGIYIKYAVDSKAGLVDVFTLHFDLLFNFRYSINDFQYMAYKLNLNFTPMIATLIKRYRESENHLSPNKRFSSTQSSVWMRNGSSRLIPLVNNTVTTLNPHGNKA